MEHMGMKVAMEISRWMVSHQKPLKKLGISDDHIWQSLWGNRKSRYQQWTMKFQQFALKVTTSLKTLLLSVFHRSSPCSNRFVTFCCSVSNLNSVSLRKYFLWFKSLFPRSSQCSKTCSPHSLLQFPMMGTPIFSLVHWIGVEKYCKNHQEFPENSRILTW